MAGAGAGLQSRTSTSDRLHLSPAWLRGLSQGQPTWDAALPGSARPALCSALLDPPSWSTERHVFIPAPEDVARAATPAGKRSPGFPSTAPRRPPTPVPHPSWGRWLPVTTMAVPASLSLSPALPPGCWGSIPGGLGAASTEGGGSGYFRNRLGCSFLLQLLPHTDKRQLRSPPALAPRRCTGRAVSAGHAGAAGRALLQGRGARRWICRAPGGAAVCDCPLLSQGALPRGRLGSSAAGL